MSGTLRKRAGLAALLAGVLAATGCDREPTVLKEIRAGGKLIVLTRNAPTTYYEGREGPEGYEYELASQFADYLGVEAEFRTIDSVDELLAAVERGEGHLGAGGISRTEGREPAYRFGPNYLSVQQEVVCRRGGNIPASAEELKRVSLRVAAGSSYVEQLTDLRQRIPDLSWDETGSDSAEQILRQVWEKQVDCTVADSNVIAVNRRYLPELVVAFPVSEEQPLAWVLPTNAPELAKAVQQWFERAEKEGVLARLHERYYGHVEIFDYVDLSRFVRRIDSRLPSYRTLFRQAAERNDLPWTLLAAQAYQESHWDPRAKSPTGVRGMMMLTLTTAGELGVKSRLDAAQSINGGAEYLARLVRRLPDSVTGEDRLWLALAAYNVGYGHLSDARTLAERLGRNPDRWVDLKEVLPLLGKKEYYRTVKHGYARGWEPVSYVQRIRDYRDVLEQRLAAELTRSVNLEPTADTL